jgi:hypothetical protein
MAFPSDYNWKLDITTDATKISSVESNFPYYFDLSNISSTDFWNNVQSDGGDLRVSTDSAGSTQVPLEVVFIDTGTQTGEIHFKDTTDSSSNKTYYLWWDDSTGAVSQPAVTDTYGRNNVWTNFDAVWHLQEDPSGSAPQMIDSTGNGNNGTTNGSMTSGDSVTGIAGNGVEFDGSNDYINFGDTNNLTENASQLYISIFSNANSTSNGDRLASKDRGDSGFAIRDNSGNAEFSLNVGGTIYDTTIGTISTSTWQQYAGLYDGSTIYTFLDGTQANTNSATGTTGANGKDLYLGAKVGGTGSGSPSNYWNGIADEFRISTDITSTGWATTENNNLSDNSNFWTVGTPTAPAQTLDVDTASLDFTGLDITFTANRVLEVDTASLTNNTYELTFVIGRTLDLDAGSVTYNTYDLSISSGKTLSVDTASLTYNAQDITFSVNRNLELETASLDFTGLDITLTNQRVLNLDSASLTFNGLDLEIGVEEVTLELDTASLTYNALDVSFKINFNEEVFTELTNALADIEEIYNEVGETVFYQVNTFSFNDGGKLSDFTNKQYPIKAMFTFATNYQKEIGDIGEYASGNKVVKLLPQYTINSTTVITPKLNDYVITEQGEKWEIIKIDDVRMFGGVIELFCEVQKRDNDWT